MPKTLTVRLDRVAPEGQALGKAEGSDKLVFVPHALPGDTLEVEVVEEQPRYLRARALKVLEAAPGRVEPACPYHFKPGKIDYCGGCDWQQAAPAAQLKLKRDVVVDALRRVGKLEPPVLETLPSPQAWRYRNKVQVPFQPGPDGGVVSGFYVPGSHRLVEWDDCLVQPELSVAIVKTVKELARKFGWRMYDENHDRGWLRHLLARTNSAGEAAAVFVTRNADFPQEKEAVEELREAHPELVSVWQNVQERKTSVVLGPRWRKLAGRDRLREKVGRLALEFSPAAFLQVNTPAAELLYRTVESYLFSGAFRPNLTLDIYCGVGAIGLWISRGTPRVVGIEEIPQAVEDAYANARRLGVRNATFVAGRAEHALRKMRGQGAPRPWGAVLDPPRAGCEEGVLRYLMEKKVERIIYVSCDPATFARDAGRLSRAYDLEKVQPIDLFPQTSHVELVAKFDLKRTVTPITDEE